MALNRRASTDTTPAALHARALLVLHRRNPAAAVDSLERARRSAPDDPGILNDLAVAYVEQGQHDHRLEPMLRALDAAGRSLARDPLHPAALFNRALILERLYLLKSAERAWVRYLAVERRPEWREEAAEHVRRLAGRADPAPPRELVERSRAGVRVAADLAVRVAAAPHQARDTSLILLGEWGASAGQGDRKRAADILAAVRRVSAELDALGADGSIRLALRAVDEAADDDARLRRLAEGHARLAVGIRLFARSSYDDAVDSLAAAAHSLRSVGSPATRWAAYYRAASLIEGGEYARADAALDSIHAEATVDEPALVGRTVRALGVSRVRRGFYDEASRFYREARPHVLRSREPENEGTLSYILSESLGLAGLSVDAHAEAYRGLRLLSPFRRSGFLNNQLSTVAAFARADGLAHAALAVRGEVLEVARLTGRADVQAWALRACAMDRAALGDTVGAQADLSTAMRLAERMPQGEGRDRVRADVMLARAGLGRGRDPGSALRDLEEVVEIYRSLDFGVYLPRALYETAMVAQELGEPDRAHLHLDEAVRLIEAQQDSFRLAESRAAHLETVESVFDAMISLGLERGRPAAAFEYLERGRIAAWPRSERRDASVSAGLSSTALADVVTRLPEGMLLLEYALLPDRMVVWAASCRGWRQYTVPAPRDSVAALVDRFAREKGKTAVDAGAARARLYDLLVRPLAGELGGVRELTVVPDRELHQLPFAALWDERSRSYLVEHVQVRTAPSAAFFLAARSEARRRSSAGPAVLVVGEPGIDASLGLPSLPGAAREAREVARLYEPARLLLTGPDAMRSRVAALLPKYPVFHFVGHAVFNVERPELSYLALAPDSAEGTGVLHAWEIGGLSLSNVNVVVLAACSTLNPRPSRAGATTGLAYSFLRAGVPATVSTLWDVEDAETTELLVEFHRRLAGGVSAPEALRQTQVAALRSRRPELQAPQVWAAFIYTGP